MENVIVQAFEDRMEEIYEKLRIEEKNSGIIQKIVDLQTEIMTKLSKKEIRLLFELDEISNASSVELAELAYRTGLADGMKIGGRV